MNEQLQNKLLGYGVALLIATIIVPLALLVICGCWGAAFHAVHWMSRAATGN